MLISESYHTYMQTHTPVNMVIITPAKCLHVSIDANISIYFKALKVQHCAAVSQMPSIICSRSSYVHHCWFQPRVFVRVPVHVVSTVLLSLSNLFEPALMLLLYLDLNACQFVNQQFYRPVHQPPASKFIIGRWFLCCLHAVYMMVWKGSGLVSVSD